MKKLLFLFAFLCLAISGANAQTITWTGAVNNNWNNAGNWNPAQIPTNVNDVIIPTGSTMTINVTASIKSIVIQGTSVVTMSSSSLTYTAASSVAANAVVNWTAGNISGASTFTNNGVFNLTTTAIKSIIGQTIFNNEGTFNIASSGDLNITDGVFNNQLAGVIDMRADAGNISYSGSASRVLNNYGLIKRTTSTGIATIDTFLNNNDGTISVESGILNFISLDKTLTDGAYNVVLGSSLGWNTNIIVAGTLTGVLDGQINWASTVTVPLATTATFNFSGSNGINWSASNLMGGGTLVNQSLLNLTTTAIKSIVGLTSLNNEAAFNIVASGDFNITNGVFNNQPTGILDMQVDAGNISYSGSASRVLNNFGLIKRTASPGIAVIDVELNNTGTISVESGILNFNSLDKALTDGAYNVVLGSSLGWNTNIIVAGTLTSVLDGQINWTNSVTVPVSTTATFDFGGSNGINWSAGNLTGGGTLVNQGLLNLTTTNTKSIIGQTNFNNEGIFNIATSGDFNINDGVFNNQPTGILDLQADAGDISWSGTGSRVLNNAGLIKRTTSLSAAGIDVELNNTGTISVESGILNFLSLSKTLTNGIYNVSTGSSLGWNTNINVAGTLTGILDGQINWTSSVTVPISTTATFDFSGSNGINWSAGNLTGGGTLVYQSLLNLTATNTKSITGQTNFNNEGTFNIADSGDFNITDGVFNNQPTGILDLQADAGNISYSGSASRVLNNFGLIKRTTSTGIATIETFLNNNDGTISVENGILNFISLDKTLTDGTYNVASGSVLGWNININVAGTLTGVLDGPINWASSVTVPFSTTATFDFSGGNGINWSAGNLTGGGTLVNQSPLNLTTTAIKSIVGLTSLNNEATFNIVASGDLNITDGVFNNQPTGILDMQVDAGDISYSGSASRVLNNYGLLKKSAGAGITNIYTQTTNSGTIEAMMGTLDIVDPLGLTNTVDGIIKGVATINIPSAANYINNGTFAPGASPGVLTVIGDFESTPSSVLEVELNGLAQGTEYDLLAITGNAIMDGNVNILLGFDASMGDEFIVATITGTITQCNLPATAFAQFDCLRYDFSVACRNNDEVVLTITAKGDVEPPVVVTQNITAQLDNNGTVTIVAIDVDGGSTDNCTLPENLTFALDVSTFTCANLGDNTVTLTVTDETGNSASAEAIVTVEDTVAPTVITQDITVQLDASGNATIVANDIDNGSTDNCTLSSLSLDITSFDCTNIGNNTVNLTAVDQSGNTSSAPAIVTVEDSVAPTAVCQNITVQLDGSGNATITAADVDNGSSDACGILSMSVSPDTFDAGDVGDNIVTLTVTDVNGNVSTCQATVTVEDVAGPTAICQNITVQLDASGNATITAADVDNGSSGNNISLSIDNDSFDCSNVGANTVVLTVTDTNGNTATCTSTVTVEDSVAPTVVCQNITVQLDASGNATITAADVDNGSSDACGVSLSIDVSSFDCSNVGANTVVLTVTDTNGNTATCTSTVTVEDSVAPTAVCQNITVQLDGSGNATITAADVDNGSSDACGVLSMSVSPDTFDAGDVGDNIVTLTVTDVNGNVSTCQATVTVEDVAGPTAICQNITVQLDASGNATITAADVDNGSSGNNISLSIDNDSFDCSNVGANTVVLTVTDNSGNTATCTSTVTVEDSVAPTAVCQNITVQLDASGNATITAADVDNGSSDACGVSLGIDVSSFDCSNVGANTVVLTVTDTNGNTATCTSTVTVEDSVAPTAVCQNITVQLDGSGNATITAADVDNGSSDACGVLSMSVSPDTFDAGDVGDNIVTLTVTDVNGNVSTCQATVTVEDNQGEGPTAICQDISVEIDAYGNATFTAEEIDNGSYGNNITLSLDIDSFSCADVGGNNTVVLTVTDEDGNTDSCTATVTLIQNTGFGIICPDNQRIDLSSPGGTYIVPDYFAEGYATVYSNCANIVTSTTQIPAAGTIVPAGHYTVKLKAQTATGRKAKCSFKLVVRYKRGHPNMRMVVMYPNVANEKVTLSNPEQIEMDEALFFDLTGRLVKTVDLKNMDIEKTIDISELSSATYIVILKGEDGQIIKKLQKE